MATVLDQRSATTIDDRSWSLNAKLFPTLNDAHSLTAGLEAEGVNRTENALTFINGAPSLPGYRAPTLQNIIAVPTLSTLYPAPGLNTASSPDKAGNPGRRPELATGIDLALEHNLSRSGVISTSVFKRNIRDLIRNVTSLETVPWAVAQRRVTRPQNIGDATTHGVEFDALMDGAPPLTLRTSLGVYGSSVSGVPGPYNRIDQQPRASANVGGDHKFRSRPLTMGGNFSWVPPYTVQDTAIQSQGYDLTRVIDAYGPWAIDKTTKIRLSRSNIVPRNCIPTNTIVGNGQSQLVTANGPTYRVVGLRLQMKLQGLRHRPTTNCVGGRPAIARALATIKKISLDSARRSMKPHVICLMMSPLDGRVEVSRWSPSKGGDEDQRGALYEATHAKLDGDAWICGRETMEEFAKGLPHPPADPGAPPRPLHVARSGASRYAVGVDSGGKLHFGGPTANGDPAIVLLGSDVTDAHLAELAADGVSYFVGDAPHVDLAVCLAMLQREFGIERLLLEGGGGLVGSMLAAGLVDEFHLLLCPAVDGTTGGRSIIEAGETGLADRVTLSLTSHELLDDGVLLMRYAVRSRSA